MKCKNVNILFDDYLTNNLDEEKRKFVETHLNICESCSKEYLVYSSLMNFISEDKKVKVSADFYKSIQKKLELDTVETGVIMFPAIQRFMVAAVVTIAILTGILTGYFTGKQYKNTNTFTQFLDETGFVSNDNSTDWTDYVYVKN